MTEVDDPPIVAYDSDYTESHGADDTSPERSLWLTVLVQAASDVFCSDEQIRQDAIDFFMGEDLLDILSYAGINTSCVPAVRERALTICQQSGRSRRRRIMFRGEAHTVKEWSQIAGLTVDTITGRIRMGWSVERALTLPLKKAGRRGFW